MNHEPIQFLPVRRFWEQPSPRERVNRAFVVGAIVGSAVTVATAWFICHLICL